MANSRDLVRSDTLFAPHFSGGGGRGAAELARQLRHFDSAEPGFKPFVAALQARTVNGLFQSVAGEYAKHDGDASVHLRELQAAGGFRADVIVMRGFA